MNYARLRNVRDVLLILKYNLFPSLFPIRFRGFLLIYYYYKTKRLIKLDKRRRRYVYTLFNLDYFILYSFIKILSIKLIYISFEGETPRRGGNYYTILKLTL